MSAIQEPTLRFPSSLSHRERELWEREAASLGHTTESAMNVMERHPIEEGEGQKLYRMRIETIRRAEAAIEDGRKEEPSQNARTHGFTAKTFRLAPGEREEDYQVRISDSLRRHQPQDSEELDQIVIIVNATWNLLRIQCAASDLMCLNYEAGTTASDALLLNKGLDFNNLARYEGNLNRTLDKARKRLKELKQDNVRGAGVPPAKEEPTQAQSPRAEEPKTKITKRAHGMAEASPSPFPGRERAGVRDGITDHASAETTKSERSGDPGEWSESGRTHGSESAVGVPPAKEEPHEPQSPRATEPKEEITKRTQGNAEDSPFPGSERQACPRAKPRRVRDGSNDHASAEITERTREESNPSRLSSKESQTKITKRTQHPNHEVVASPSQGFEAQRRTLVEDTTATPTLEGLSPQKPAQKEITKRNQKKVKPSRLTPHPSRPEPHSNNQQLTRQQPARQHKITKRTQPPPEPLRLDATEKQELCARACAFVARRSWCRAVSRVFLAWGSQKLALCLAYAASGEEARWVWVVVGELSPAHLDPGRCPNAEEALKEYVAKTLAWAEAAKTGQPLDKFMPMFHPTTHERLKPTPEAIHLVQSRARFIEEKILGPSAEELRVIRAQPR